MSYSISTLLIRNLQDVFGENDPARRRAAIDDIWTEDGVFYDPKTGVYRGRDEIDRVAGAIRATHPDFQYQPITKPEELGDGGRIQWVSGRPEESPAYPRRRLSLHLARAGSNRTTNRTNEVVPSRAVAVVRLQFHGRSNP